MYSTSRSCCGHRERCLPNSRLPPSPHRPRSPGYQSAGARFCRHSGGLPRPRILPPKSLPTCGPPDLKKTPRTTPNSMPSNISAIFMRNPCVSRHGHAFIDRALYLPQAWATDAKRRTAAHVPSEIGFATKPTLARRMIARAIAAEVPFAWVAADTVYGVGAIAMALRRAGKGYVLGVASDQMFNSWDRTPPISGTAAEIAATLKASAWQRLSAGEGTKGPRLHDWAYLALADLEANEHGEDRSGLWTRGLLIRRDLADGKMAFFTTWCPTDTSIETLVWVEGHRWAVEDGFETAKNELGLDHNETRSWNGWHRHVSLVMLAFAMLAAIRHRLNAETMTAEQPETVPSARPRPVRGRHRWDRGLDPLVGAGDPPRGRAAEPAAHPARSHHRLVALAKGPSSRRTHLAS